MQAEVQVMKPCSVLIKAQGVSGMICLGVEIMDENDWPGEFFYPHTRRSRDGLQTLVDRDYEGTEILEV